MKHDGNDLLRRQDCIEAIEGITCSMSLCVNADECHGMQRMRKQAVIELANMPAAQPDHNADSGKKVDGDCISRQAAIDVLDAYQVMVENGEENPYSWARLRMSELPSVQPYHVADVSKKDERTDETAQNTSSSCAHENDLISREMAIEALARMMPRSYTPDGSHPADEEIFRAQEVFADCIEALEILPSAQPEIIHCGECIYYDPPHVEKEDARYEYSEMPKEAFDVLGTGLVSMEYGINIGGRCCVDYYCKSYSDDKRVYVREDNYCGRAERRTDETD